MKERERERNLFYYKLTQTRRKLKTIIIKVSPLYVYAAVFTYVNKYIFFTW